MGDLEVALDIVTLQLMSILHDRGDQVPLA